ncbi:MAG: TldD/PmbA family protein [Bacteroidales bacterium]|nr:TldD/PmbA family protein [Bacteroidales bacterium]
MKKILIIFTLFLCITGLKAEDPVLKTLMGEATRNLDVLKKQTVPAYFIAYRLIDIEAISLSGTFGSISGGEPTHNRFLQVQTRVGDYHSDNSHEMKNADYSSDYENKQVPFEDGASSMEDILWQKTDESYKNAVQKYKQIKANSAVTTASEDKSPDFSRQKADINYEKPIHLKDLKIDVKKWEELLTRLSSLMNSNKDIKSGGISFSCEVQRRWFYNTEGSSNAENAVSFRLFVNMAAMTEDGMDLPLFKSYFAFKAEDLPTEKELSKEILSMGSLLSELKKAPLAEPYSGPSILSAEAAGVLFHEFFGHRVEGARMKQDGDAQTFKKKIGEKVLSEKISVTYDPSIRTFQGQALNGSYTMDDEGVRGQRVEVVKDGILNGFLMSRTPLEGFPESNGHGRSAYYYNTPVTRQSNMFIKSSQPLSNDSLVGRLKKELKTSGKEYGYLFCSVSGGFTTTGRYTPNAFNVTPLVVYRIYADNRPQQLVRGVNMIGTPLSVFSQILECGDDYQIFNGTCGAESGGIPVACIAPALLVRQIETQKKPKTGAIPPILERP